jgi:flagellar biosynthetic protein FliO
LRKILIASLVMAFFGVSAMAEELPGPLIDQLMRKQAGEVTTLTAESALPVKHTDTPLSNITVSAEKILKNDSNALPKTETKISAANEESQPVFSGKGATISENTSSSKTGLWGRMFGSLAIIILMIGGAVYGLKKWPGSQKLGVRNRMIEVIAQHHLGPKKSIAVVRVAGEAVLIGVTDNNISILKSLALLDEDLPASAIADAGAKSGRTAIAGRAHGRGVADKFTSALVSKFAKQNTSGVSEPDAETDIDAIGAAEAAAGSAATYTRRSAAGKFTINNEASNENDEEFAMKGIKEIVGQKLKTMKEL